MFRLVLLVFLLPALPLQAAQLLWDQHAEEAYIFDSDQADVRGTVDQGQATIIGTKWAMRFYRDPFLNTLDCEYRVRPIRYWLVSFSRDKEKFFAVVLPDGSIIEPQTLQRIIVN